MAERPPEDDQIPPRPDLRRERVDDEELHRRFARAALEASAEHGYQKLTVAAILARAGASRTVFYRLFANKEDCFERAYALAAADVAERLLATCAAAADWRAGFGATLAGLADFLESEWLLADGVVVQARVAGAAVEARRRALLDRFVAAAEDARGAVPHPSPAPAAAARFLVGAVDESAARCLADGDPGHFRAAVPDLEHLAETIFFPL